MPTTTETRPTAVLAPQGGCGTLESPWTGWEPQLETPDDTLRTFTLAPGFYGAARPVRIAAGITLQRDPLGEGRAWFLPAAPDLDALFHVEHDEIRLRGLCFNGRATRCRTGLRVTAGTGLTVSECRFEDFGAPGGAAVEMDASGGKDQVRSTVITASHFLSSHGGVILGRDVSDVLIADNRFEEMAGPAVVVDPRDQWADYGLIFCGNRVRSVRVARRFPFVSVRPGAEGLRIAENTFEAERDSARGEIAALEIRGGGPLGRRRVEVILNRVIGSGGPGVHARQCGPGFLAAGNTVVGCGTPEHGAMDLVGCRGVLVEDNEIGEAAGPGIRAQDCSFTRFNGNEIEGGSPTLPRGGSFGLLIQGDGSQRLRLTDNRVRAVRDQGIRIESGRGLRVVGNEVEDCGAGIRACAVRSLLLVGNDCRDNTRDGIRLDEQVRGAFVALNYSILNGTTDLDVRADRARCRSNKVDREGRPAAAPQ